MRIHIPGTALGLAVAAFAPAAHAETIVTRQIVNQPVETVRTVTTTRTIRPAPRHRVVETRRTTVTDRAALVAPAGAAARAQIPAAAGPVPVYDVAPPAPPVYDVAAPAPVVAAPVDDDDTVVGAPPLVDQALVPPPPPVGAVVPAYQYVYQWDRILVIDPATGIAVQSIPR
jgi:hypothetical protein